MSAATTPNLRELFVLTQIERGEAKRQARVSDDLKERLDALIRDQGPTKVDRGDDHVQPHPTQKCTYV